MLDRLKFALNRLSERLWVRPLVMCVVSVAGAFLAKAADRTEMGRFVPYITPDSIEALLTILSASMLVIATFSLASMVSAYASASSTATPRAFSLVVADDVSQNALSTFIGAFIFSIVALIALKNGYFADAGRFALFVLTLATFAIVVLTFVRWVDRIARLGRLGETIGKVERACADSLHRRRAAPRLGGVAIRGVPLSGGTVFASSVGYVQRVDVAELQKCAEKLETRVRVEALPGTFAAPGRALVSIEAEELSDADRENLEEAFLVGEERIFDEDPRFGLVVLSEIASRALSPAVNDPGTAIDVLGRLVRVLTTWTDPADHDTGPAEPFDRVEVPEVSLRDMFDDAFAPIARDGASLVEVVLRLQKALASLSTSSDASVREAARHHGRLALARAESALELPEDLTRARDAAQWAFGGD